MRELLLRDGEVALVDDEDCARVNLFDWRMSALGYAWRYVGKQRYQYLHRFILGDPATNEQRIVIDHRNRDRLDNQKSNLRVTSKSVNGANRANVGVTRSGAQWRARIQIGGISHELGRFATRAEAVVAREGAHVFYRL